MRLFVALRLPGEVRRPLAETAAGLARRLPPARWVPAANLHLTLSFLGETEPDRLGSLGAALAGCFGPRRPMALRLGGGGCFPPRRPARVAWVGFEAAPALLDLQRAVAAAVGECLGVEPERRPFHPHLTLARPRRPWPRSAVALWIEAFAGPQGPAFEVGEGQLMRSHLGPDGARHESLAAYPLAGAGGAL
jgi:2'-5' RNA ligase